MTEKKLLLIFHPGAGRQEFAPNLYEVVEQFTRRGFLVTAYPTQGPRDAYRMVRAHAAEYDYLVCSGGDGTLNESIDALMFCDRRPIFGFIPSGTTNDFATSLGLPKDALQAVATITDGVSTSFDIGRFGSDYFSYVAAFGLFTDVSYATPQSKKNVLGHLAYLLEGVKRLGSIQSYKCSIDLGEEVLSGEFLFGMITNSLSVGGFKLPGEAILMDDGLFEVVLLQMPRNFIDLQNVIASLLNGERYTDSLIVRKAARVIVRSEIPLSWTLDGEYGGEYGEIEIQNWPCAIDIMRPAAGGR